MEQANITIALDPLRLEALEYFLKQENTSVQKQMDEALKKLYEEKVPETMRGYLDWKVAPSIKAKRPAKPAVSKASVQQTAQERPTPTEEKEEKQV